MIRRLSDRPLARAFPHRQVLAARDRDKSQPHIGVYPYTEQYVVRVCARGFLACASQVLEVTLHTSGELPNLFNHGALSGALFPALCAPGRHNLFSIGSYSSRRPGHRLGVS